MGGDGIMGATQAAIGPAGAGDSGAGADTDSHAPAHGEYLPAESGMAAHPAMTQPAIGHVPSSTHAPSGAASLCGMDSAAPAAADLSAWNRITGDASTPNVFAEPWMLLPALRRLDAGWKAQLLMARSADGAPLGVAAVTMLTGFGRLPLRCAALWQHANGFLAPVQAAAGSEQAFWDTLITGISAQHRDTPILWLDGIVEGSALHHGLLHAAAARGLPVRVERREVRAMLATDQSPDAYWQAAVRPKKRKELRRQWARLAETGAITVDSLPADADPTGWIEEFLSLEASGWKGDNGSALASQADTAGFFRDAMAAGHGDGRIVSTALRVDGRAIAMLVTLLSATAGFSFKTAFDENMARFSPGVLLQRESLFLLAERRLDWIDSCASPDHPMIDHLWRERRAILTLALPLPGRANRLIFAAATGAQRLWHRVKPMIPYAAPPSTEPAR